jgi:diadenosine tetraphosphate (Ap4A) HIT family hydrolase
VAEVSSGCVLCSTRLASPVIRETPLWRVAVNLNQSLLGKLIVVLRRHQEAVARLTADEWSELHGLLIWSTERVKSAFAPDHFNYAFLQNQDRHVHLHVIPRYATPRHFAGLDFNDPEFPTHYRADVQRWLGVDTMNAVAAALTDEQGVAA